MRLNEYIAKQFGNPTGLGGRIISYIMNRQNHGMYDETMRLLKPVDSDNILDIGCGNGYMLNMLARKCACNFTGIDTSKSAIQDASKRNRAFAKNGRMSFLCQNASAMSFPGSSFSKAYTVNTVYFWADLGETMAEIHRVLKVGGVFLNTLYTGETLDRYAHTQFGYRRFTAEELTRAGVNAGFTADVTPILGGAAYCVRYTKAN